MDCGYPGLLPLPEDGALTVANPQYTLDMEAAQASLSMPLALPADTYHRFHGGTFRRNA